MANDELRDMVIINLLQKWKSCGNRVLELRVVLSTLLEFMLDADFVLRFDLNILLEWRE